MISVIIRSFNNGNTIERAIKSVLSQTLSLREIEIVVVDDGSSDNSLSKIKSFAKNIRFYQTKRLGAIKALNFGIEKSYGEYFTILDADDFLPDNTLSSLLSGFETDPQAAGVYGDYYEIEARSVHKQYQSTGSNIFSTVAGGWLFKKEIIAQLGYYDTQLFFPEYDLLKKILKKYHVVHIPKIVYYYCRQRGNLTVDKKRVEKGIKQLEEKYGEEIPIRGY